MSNSPLVDYVAISPNKNVGNYKKTGITVHHMAGNLTVETCGNVFAKSSAQASSNYGIGTDGRVGLYVYEKDRSWASSNRENDESHVTIETSNDEIGGNWHVSDKAWNKLIDLCVDICKRNGIEKLTWTGDTRGNLTCHYMFAATNCPGPYLKSKMAELANEVNARLNGTVKTGWVLDDQGWWWRNEDGSWPANTWKKIDNEWYWFEPSGYIAEDCWKFIDNKWYLFDKSGKMLKGWQIVNGTPYFLNDSGDLVIGEIDAKLSYDFNGNLISVK